MHPLLTHNQCALSPYLFCWLKVLLRWSIERKFTIIPKTSNPDRLAENLALFDFALDAEDMQVLAKLERNLRFNDSFCAGPGLMN